MEWCQLENVNGLLKSEAELALKKVPRQGIIENENKR